MGAPSCRLPLATGWEIRPRYNESPMLPLGSRDLRALRRALLDWYDAHRRDLPWRRDARSLSRLGVGDHAAADPRGRRAGTLRAIHAALSYGPGTGLVPRAVGAGAVERAGLLPSRPPPASGCEGHRARAQRRISAYCGSLARASRHRTLHRGCYREHRLRRSRRRSRWQRRARAGASVRQRRGKGISVAASRNPARSRPSGRLQPGHDGIGCDRLHAARSAVPAVSAV